MKYQNLISFVLISAVTAGPVLENAKNVLNVEGLPNTVQSKDSSALQNYGDDYEKPEYPDIHDKLEDIKDKIKDKIIKKKELIKHLFDCLIKIKFDKLKKLIELKKRFLKKLVCKDYFDKPGYYKESDLPKPYRIIKSEGTDSTTFSQADLDFNPDRVNFITNKNDEVVDVMLG